MQDDISKKAINTLRVLSVEAIEKANSGHPGIALGAAPIMYSLFARAMRHNPKNPQLLDRDRFILSAGHGSSLLYSCFHLFGYGIKKEDLQNFRQLNSKTPGHPEYGVTAGVETSTGPLGQGLANGVGFALAEKMLSARFNKKDIAIVDHYTFVLCGDGDIQEGIASEAASLAGTWKLNKLIVLYDSNDITIEGKTSTNFTETVLEKYKAMGFNTIRVENGSNTEEILLAIEGAKKQTEKPTIIEVKTVIGEGSPKAGCESCHGAPLGTDALAKTKELLCNKNMPFEVCSEVKKHFEEIVKGLEKHEKDYDKKEAQYKKKYKQEYSEYKKALEKVYPDITNNDQFFQRSEKCVATRSSSEVILNKLAKMLPSIVGGSADLGPSNKTILKDMGYFSHLNPLGRNIQFGVREHAMAAICNGLALHGGFIPYCATFLVFSDYLKHAVRMSALMGLNVIYIFSHDSIGVGEDGPTHQPIEQILQFRSIPNVKVFRPCDSVETGAAYAVALKEKGPSCIITSRQDLPAISTTSKEALKGGYILLKEKAESPDVILLSSGSEVSLCLEAASLLEKDGISVRVVSMPCIELFEKQATEYKEAVLPNSVRARVAVEAGSSLSWHRLVGLDGGTVTIDQFGQSAPANVLFKLFGFTKENIVETCKRVIEKQKK